MSIQFEQVLVEMEVINALGVRLPAVEEAVQLVYTIRYDREALKATSSAATEKSIASAVADGAMTVADAVPLIVAARREELEADAVQRVLHDALSQARRAAIKAFGIAAEEDLLDALLTPFEEAIKTRHYETNIEIWSLVERVTKAGLIRYGSPVPSPAELRYRHPERLQADMDRGSGVNALVQALRYGAEPWLPTPSELRRARALRGELPQRSTSAPGRTLVVQRLG